jgi:hypothetical protein
MDYNAIVLNGYTNKDNRNRLANYFVDEFKKVENQSISMVDFFEGCMKVVKELEATRDNQYKAREIELITLLENAKARGDIEQVECRKNEIENHDEAWYKAFISEVDDRFKGIVEAPEIKLMEESLKVARIELGFEKLESLAQDYYEKVILNGREKGREKLNSGIEVIRQTLNRIEAKESDVIDLYKRGEMDPFQPTYPNDKYHSEIELYRIIHDYYKTHPYNDISIADRKVEHYARHKIFKQALSKELEIIQELGEPQPADKKKPGRKNEYEGVNSLNDLMSEATINQLMPIINERFLENGKISFDKMKGTLVIIIRHLYYKGYYSGKTQPLTNSDVIKSIAHNSFSTDISEGTIKGNSKTSSNDNDPRLIHIPHFNKLK